MILALLLLLSEPDKYVARVNRAGELEIRRRDELPPGTKIWPRSNTGK